MTTIDGTPNAKQVSEWLPKNAPLVSVEEMSFKAFFAAEQAKTTPVADSVPVKSDDDEKSAKKDQKSDVEKGVSDDAKQDRAGTGPVLSSLLHALTGASVEPNVTRDTLSRVLAVVEIYVNKAAAAGLRPGDEVRFVAKGDVNLEIRIRVLDGKPVVSIRGDKEMNALIREHLDQVTQIVKTQFNTELASVTVSEQTKFTSGGDSQGRQQQEGDRNSPDPEMSEEPFSL